jgi:hypothetical protein
MRDCERGRSVKFRASSACLRSSYDSANVAGARAFASIRSDLMRSRPRSAASWLKIARGGPKAGRCAERHLSLVAEDRPWGAESGSLRSGIYQMGHYP